MPFQSKSQVRKFYAMEDSGEVPVGTAKRWTAHTPSIKSLPERADDKDKQALDLVSVLGRMTAKVAGSSDLVGSPDTGSIQLRNAALVHRGEAALPFGAYAEPFSRAAEAGSLSGSHGGSQLLQSAVAPPLPFARPVSPNRSFMSRRPGMTGLLGMLGAAGLGIGAGHMFGSPRGSAVPAETPPGGSPLATMGSLAPAAPDSALTPDSAPPGADAAAAPAPSGAEASPGILSKLQDMGRGLTGSIKKNPLAWGAGALGAGVGAYGLSKLMSGRRKKREDKEAAEIRRLSPGILGLRKAVLYKLACLAQQNARTSLVHYLDKVASYVPITHQARIRVLQSEVAAGRPLSGAIKRAYPMLHGEQRGILAVKLAEGASTPADAGLSSLDAMRQQRLMQLQGQTETAGQIGRATGGLGGAYLGMNVGKGPAGSSMIQRLATRSGTSPGSMGRSFLGGSLGALLGLLSGRAAGGAVGRGFAPATPAALQSPATSQNADSIRAALGLGNKAAFDTSREKAGDWNDDMLRAARRYDNGGPLTPGLAAFGTAGGAMTGMVGGGLLGGAVGAARGNTAEGLGRGVLRGGLTGAGTGLGNMIAHAASRNQLVGLLGALTGGAGGYMLGGKLLGKPVGDGNARDKDKDKAAFDTSLFESKDKDKDKDKGIATGGIPSVTTKSWTGSLGKSRAAMGKICQ